MIGDLMVPGYMHIVSSNFSILGLVFAIDGRIVDAAQGRPGAATIARAAAKRLYSQFFGDGLISPGFIRPRLDPVIIDPASIGA
eukprot:6411843-Pyramimonas_sp.AAC.1